jgi:hypothetical protein
MNPSIVSNGDDLLCVIVLHVDVNRDHSVLRLFRDHLLVKAEFCFIINYSIELDYGALLVSWFVRRGDDLRRGLPIVVGLDDVSLNKRIGRVSDIKRSLSLICDVREDIACLFCLRSLLLVPKDVVNPFMNVL